ncbi:uncharacterized protein LOC122645094 [Telopea speciosissima]|uniref:uncharacterized protein LOC122645094 n=1 Tax=Telopea speciosissima TaxID=54955 RepID=UPI001CC71FAB|nr:uncharacterized protein LOC122645094 [Telopea speciosissima]
MISVNDDEDLHFRKAEFDPDDCPSDCSRPCEMVCPANAISLELIPGEDESTNGKAACGKFQGGVITERCYGCGRCVPVCPYDKIRAATYVRNAAETAQLLERSDVDAVEIHTSGRQTDSFEELWNRLGDSIWHVKLVAVSLPYIGDSTVPTMNRLFSIMGPRLSCYNLWQLDGRPMSGDIGQGATREAIAFAVHLAALRDRPHGFLQLAGGTNLQTVDGLKKAGLFQKTENGSQKALIGGVAYGGYARKIVGRVLSQIQSHYGLTHIEDHPDYFLDALKGALTLVGTVKCYNFPSEV